MYRRLASLFWCFVVLAMLGACSSAVSPTPSSAPTSGVAPEITTQPTNQSVAAGATATFSVAASGTAPRSYQWQLNGVAIAGATSASYTTPATTSADNGASFVCVVTNAQGSATSNAATLTVGTPPQITTQPVSQTVAVGATATFSVVANGTGLTYQWQLNGVAISSATSASYTTSATTAADEGGSFTVVVTNGGGQATSSAAILTVVTPPQITTQPSAQTVAVGATATFNVAAAGVGLTYQWSRGGTPISGATQAVYTTAAVAMADSGASFTVVVTNIAGSVTSTAAILTVTAATSGAPQITTQPVNQSVNAPGVATFSVAASGTAPLSYQWRKNAANISGATAATYTTPATASGDNGAVFSVVVSNSAGSVTSSGATLTVSSLPQITTQPASRSVNAGQTATFTVAATGSGTLTYQWRKSGTAIPGATGASYTTPATVSGDNGAVFTVVVSNVVGNVTSAAAVLTVTSPPSITTQPANKTVTAGATATFSVVASGAGLSYQWSKSGAAISGATSSTYTTPATTVADNGAMFTVVVTNSVGSTTSNPATLTVNAAPPTITTQPANMTVVVGATATFSVTATGSGTLSYQWNKGGAPISGATGASYTTPATVSGDTGSTFTVVVTNSGGSITSNAATLTVTVPPPSITTQPASTSVTAGQTATFTVAASGSGTLTYQWKKGAANISGATAASYTTPATVTGDNGAVFTVVVSNSGGSTTSSGATLTVNSPPLITTQPVNRTVTAGQTATFSVAASGTATLTYLWKKNGATIAGATSASYTTPATVLGDSGTTFAVTVTNSYGSANSNTVTLTVTAGGSGTNVLTYKFDALRSGANTTETVLTPANVNSANFGLLQNLSVDSYVDAQPLYLSGFSIGGASHNVVYIATENNSLYAYDSDTGVKLWQVTLNGSGETPSDDMGCSQVEPSIGITSTPVIDLNAGPNGTIFVVAMSKDGSGNYHQRLHALDLTTGAERSGSPTNITATYGSTTFAPGQYEERAGLLLVNGTIYTTWTSHCDFAPYGGWIITFNEATFARSGMLNIAPGASGSGYAAQGPAIWMSDGGPAADAAGNVYFLAGNGRFETSLDGNGFPSGGDYGNSFVKLNSSASAPAVVDYFAMSNEVSESTNDTDLGSGGILLLPDLTDLSGTVQHLAVGAGKDGNLYVVNRDNMGKFNAGSGNSQIYQFLSGVLNGGIWSTPAYFNGNLYYGPEGGRLLAFSVVNALVSGAPTSQGPSFGYPGTSPVVSANGTSNGIVWAYEKAGSAVLHAFDATNLGTELYNSTQAGGSRDSFGAPNKFITVTVADGKVFAASTSSVAVFGLLH